MYTQLPGLLGESVIEENEDIWHQRDTRLSREKQEKNGATAALTQDDNKLESQHLRRQDEPSCPPRASNQSQLALEEKQQQVWDKSGTAVMDGSIHLQRESRENKSEGPPL